MVSHPETGSYSPIGSDRDRGRDNSATESVVDVGFYSCMWNHKPKREMMEIEKCICTSIFTLHLYCIKALVC